MKLIITHIQLNSLCHLCDLVNREEGWWFTPSRVIPKMLKMGFFVTLSSAQYYSYKTRIGWFGVSIVNVEVDYPCYSAAWYISGLTLCMNNNMFTFILLSVKSDIEMPFEVIGVKLHIRAA